MATAPSALLSVSRLVALVAGTLYGSNKVGYLQKVRDEKDKQLIKKWDEEQEKLPVEKRHYLGMFLNTVYGHVALAFKEPAVKFGVHEHGDHGHH